MITSYFSPANIHSVSLFTYLYSLSPIHTPPLHVEASLLYTHPSAHLQSTHTLLLTPPPSPHIILPAPPDAARPRDNVLHKIGESEHSDHVSQLRRLHPVRKGHRGSRADPTPSHDAGVRTPFPREPNLARQHQERLQRAAAQVPRFVDRHPLEDGRQDGALHTRRGPAYQPQTGVQEQRDGATT